MTSDAPAAPRVAVVIVSYNAAEYLPRALDALRAQTVAPDRTILVDNASSDGTVELVRERFPRVEVIEAGANVGFAPANNIGVRAADDCDLVALLNPDAFPEPRWLEALLRAADEHPRHAFFGSRLMQAARPELIDTAGDAFHVGGLAVARFRGLTVEDAPEALAPGETFSACAAAALYRRDAFLAVGGFDESFGSYMEDTDLAFRLRLAGERGRYAPDSVVLHVGSGVSGVESEYVLYHSFRNIIWNWVKNMPLPLLVLYLPQHLLTNVLTSAWFALRGHGRTLARGKRDALRDLRRVLRERRAIQRRRAADWRELRRLMDGGLGIYVQQLRRSRAGRS